MPAFQLISEFLRTQLFRMFYKKAALTTFRKIHKKTSALEFKVCGR